MIVIPGPVSREIDDLPQEIREDLADALARLDDGQSLSMPLSRPLPDVGQGVHEVRLRDRSGAYRVIYALVVQGIVHVLHAFKKTTRTIPRRNLELAKRRLSEVEQQVEREKRR